jgi:hypothetical protein
MSATMERLAAALADRYRIERELGGGGMSRVFVADEVALGRTVVVKVVAPELLEGLSAERFTREVRLAARLQQANIVPLLSAGDADGLPYYTMPFVEGLSLRARLAVRLPRRGLAGRWHDRLRRPEAGSASSVRERRGEPAGAAERLERSMESRHPAAPAREPGCPGHDLPRQLRGGVVDLRVQFRGRQRADAGAERGRSLEFAQRPSALH